MGEARSAKEIFLEAIDLEGEAREALIARECAGDAELEGRVRRLIAADEGADAAGLLQQTPALPPERDAKFTVMAAIEALQGSAPRVALPGDSDPAPVQPTAPGTDTLPAGPKGNYQIVGEIARGGMGVVLRGRDTDLGREVAVKVLHQDLHRSHSTVDRFIEEAQIGGQLQHPGIVPVYELGLMGDDRPYFTMKLIRGRTLKELLAERTDPSEDLARMVSIFEHVCQTVAYAHSRSVIHRDLKPGNVMVGKFGEVQVVDWGLAKVIDAWEGGDKPPPRGPRDTGWVETVRSKDGSSAGSDSIAGSVMGTPAYMSPEQARGEIERLDERTDVFALGAILCEILTGKGPYAHERKSTLLMASQAELEPAFARLEACGADEELVHLALACMAPAREARPRTAGIVAATLARYSQAVEQRLRKAQISAVTERTRAKAARKIQRMATAAAALVAVALVISVLQWKRATQAAARANRAAIAEASARDALDGKNRELEQANLDLLRSNDDLELALERVGSEARKAVAVSEFLTGILSSSTPLKGGRHDVTVRSAIDVALDEVDRGKLQGQPLVEGKVRCAAGDALIAMGHYDEGREQLEVGRDLLLAAGDGESTETLGTLLEIGGALREVGRLEEAETIFNEVLDRIATTEGVAPTLHPELLGGLASIARDRARYEEAEAFSLEAVDRARDAGHEATLAVQLNDLAITLSRIGKLEEAIAAQEEANALDLKVRGEDHYGTAISLSNLASYQGRAGRIEEAEANYLRALEILRATAGERHPLVASSLGSLGRLYTRERRYHDAWRALTGSLEIRREVLDADDVDLAFALNNLATLEVDLGLIDDAAAHLAEAHAIFLARLGEEHPNTITVDRNLTGVRQRQGRPESSALALRRLATEAEERLGAADVETAHRKKILAGALREAGELAEAQELYTQALEVIEVHFGPDSPESAEVMNALAGVLGRMGDLADAELLARRALLLRREGLGSVHAGVAMSLATLAEILVARGEPGEALRALEEALEILEQVRPRHHWRLASVLSDRAPLLADQGLLREAERDLLEAHGSLTDSLGPRHTRTLQAAERLVDLYRAWDAVDPGGDRSEAIEWWSAVVEGVR